MDELDRANTKLREVLDAIDHAWEEADGKERAYLSDAADLLERGGSKMVKALSLMRGRRAKAE